MYLFIVEIINPKGSGHSLGHMDVLKSFHFLPIILLSFVAFVAPFILIVLSHLCIQLCKIDSEGKARKVVGCSCVVVKVKAHPWNDISICFHDKWNDISLFSISDRFGWWIFELIFCWGNKRLGRGVGGGGFHNQFTLAMESIKGSFLLV